MKKENQKKTWVSPEIKSEAFDKTEGGTFAWSSENTYDHT